VSITKEARSKHLVLKYTLSDSETNLEIDLEGHSIQHWKLREEVAGLHSEHSVNMRDSTQYTIADETLTRIWQAATKLYNLTFQPTCAQLMRPLLHTIRASLTALEKIAKSYTKRVTI